MNHPEPSRIREMCDMMERAHEKYDVGINMLEVSVDKTPCGTVCCHAGLFSLAKSTDENGETAWPYKWENLGKDFEEGPETDRLTFTALKTSENVGKGWVSYTDGVHAMQMFLGHDDLRMWAKRNSKLWGNPFGRYMFEDKMAFVPGSSSITVKDIIQHWREVADRIEELNNG